MEKSAKPNQQIDELQEYYILVVRRIMVLKDINLHPDYIVAACEEAMDRIKLYNKKT